MSLPPFSLKDGIERHQLQADKRLGQHFLLDMAITQRIVRTAGDLSGHHVIEIGPGPGGLTRAILESDAAHILAVELDPRAVALIHELQAYDNRLHVLHADALAINVADHTKAPRCIIANLPYNAGTEMLVQWLHHIDDFTSLTLMFQKEVAQRIAAAPGSKAYGRLSVLAQYCCRVKKLFDLPAGAFSPPPKVTSSVIQLVPHRADERKTLPIEKLEAVTAAAFGQRRKMLRGSLKTIFDNPEAILDACNIAPTRRAEELNVDEFIKLARMV